RLLVALLGFGDDPAGVLPLFPAADAGRLALQVLVHLEEVGDLPQEVGWDVVQLLDPVPLRVADGYCQDLFAGTLLVPHLKDPYGTGPDDATGKRGLAHQHQRVQLDRKSTRLNSSHVKISYAVFCSKKKNQLP